MSMKKNIAKLKKGRALIQQGQQAAQLARQVTGKLGGGLGGAAAGTAGLIPGSGFGGGIGGGSAGTGAAGLIPGGGFGGGLGGAGGGAGQGLVARAASGQSGAAKALQKAGQLLGGGGGTAPSGLQFTLTAGGLPPETFVVTDFSLTEGFSQPFHLTVGLASADPAIDFPAVLDRSATLTILQEGVEQRSITGMVARFEQGNTGLHQTTYQMSIYPDLWRTTLRQNSRIFQQLDIAAILTTLLKEHGIRDVVFSLRHPHPAREFCVQYQESDFTFLQRLTAEEGIFYFFECGSGRNTLVFADDAGSVPPGIVLPYQPGEGSTTGTPSVGSFTCSAQVRPAQVQLKDYTFKNPAWPAEFSQQMKEDTLQQRYYEHYDYPGRFKDEAHGQAFTRYRLEALRSDAVTGQGSGQAIAVQPGKLFTLDNHPRADLNQPWQVVSASHAGSQPQARETASGDSGTTLHSQFSFIRHNQHWRPAPRPKPTIDGPQIAKVVGPAGEEIFCDQYGRIRLQFPWDRYGKSDDQSSCWIRVSQPWAGQGWGMLAIPRIGQEVVVDFLHGDPDQPIVTGRTYHASNIPPGALPGSKTQMAFRSKTHKGEGYNELLFEDAKGSEKLALHAQKDMDTTVLNGRATRVTHDHTESVGNNQVITVRKDRHKEVIGMEVSSIGTRQVTVEKTSVLSVKGAITVQSVEDGIHIGNTKGSISIDKDGNIHITGVSVIINGQQVITLN
ncbi:type VI secretion system tip protein VgrG [Xenorhabdus bovienii]|uniref:type VI secretion system Vgr family protein n=4 Tax=Xenorhabdus bovienii TaxID=40576 RepID=UPI0023B28178|nr:type VI secretion system tip protein VgrG [Xenorhabdus bovienii]MDE9493549.1 type VI secretion system tip protein VgrG [Xenorhabdus bovienii]MDE9502086.1 type VI secretion system tip protein VgrG [Xenorhabdus bovienii]MDE9525937.1 type VI secretion system tip protein VgrG [Xenorhabdus bovienii]MDE9569376.1 type VI secretion system tip protein VgrG [Xenorhabdus bovienii]